MNQIIKEIANKVAFVTLDGIILSLQTLEGTSKTFILQGESVSDDTFHESLHTWLMNNSKSYMERFSQELYSKLKESEES